MAMADASVEVINLDKMIVAMSDGVILPIIECFDEYGEECDVEDAVACLAGTEEYGWLSFELPDDDGPTVH